MWFWISSKRDNRSLFYQWVTTAFRTGLFGTRLVCKDGPTRRPYRRPTGRNSRELHWSEVMTLKPLYFLCLALDPEKPPPVPLNGEVNWQGETFVAHCRYMSAIRTWAKQGDGRLARLKQRFGIISVSLRPISQVTNRSPACARIKIGFNQITHCIT